MKLINCVTRNFLPALLLAAASSIAFNAAADTRHTDYALDIRIDPATHELEIRTEIQLPENYAGRTLEFLLTDAVEIVEAEPAVRKLDYDGSMEFMGINGSSVEMNDNEHAALYAISLPDSQTAIRLTYRGVINFALGDEKEQYTRGFRSTAGIIGEQGIYLAGSSLWYPYFSNELISFDMTVNVPDGWHLISQGNGVSREPIEGQSAARSRWDSGGAVDEIYLVGGPLQRHFETAGPVMAEVYLRTPDEALAKKYLTATAQYLEMYRTLIGPYPYEKFALVENFWETGYGMPSFTLLGPQIIRFPFILTSSYPHEILHNWWGNSVFVDYPTGNWCEGLTAYMADHLIQEQRDRGAEYRRDTLKKYRDFVSEDRDFPLTEFRSRHSAATEAVGYGKTMMGFHMLRLKIGDDRFRQVMQRFYRNNLGRQASFADLRTEFEAVSELDLEEFFTQWVEWSGAVDLVARKVKTRETDDGWSVRGQLVQTQGGKPYRHDVPVYITTAAGLEQKTVTLTGKKTRFTLTTGDEPLLLEIDPEFDLFRLLDPRETAPSIGQIFGEAEIIAVLPENESADRLAGYRQLLEGWQSLSHDIRIVSENEIDSLPDDRAAWLLGADNELARRLFGDVPGLQIAESGLTAQGQNIPRQDHSSVIIRRHPDDDAKAVGWISVDPVAAFSGIGTKLPHYGKYSYLGFAGNEPENMAKGEWVATDSPLRVDLRPAQRQAGAVAAAAPPVRAALAETPSVFSREKLLEHVAYLASAELSGRGLGTAGLAKAADYIEAQFTAAGLAPGGDNGTYRQVFRVPEGEDGKPHDVANIVAVIPGTNPEFAGQAVLVTAHYDHLGRGWPDARAEDKGKIYHGADDNASGVAILIELARLLVDAGAPQRSIVFVAFTAEESGLQGSRYYAENPTPTELDGIVGVVNMDTIGRLEGGDISVFCAGSAAEWPHIFRGIGFTAGIGSKIITSDLASSDHQSFIDRGVPGVQISSGAKLDYHRPTDTFDKIDGAGMVTASMFVKETVAYLAERPEPMTITIDGSAKVPTPGSGGQRRVSVGTVPDFAFRGHGVRVDDVVPGSAAAQAGIEAGDIVTSLAGQDIANLQGFTDLLKTLSPGSTVPVVFERDGQTLEAEVELQAR